MLKDFLTIYWSQTILLLAAVGFLIRRILDLRITSIVTKENIFQQSRISAIMRFLDSYVELQALYRQILKSQLALQKINDRDFVLTLDVKYQQLYNNYFYFHFLLDPLEQARYFDLIQGMQSIKTFISETSSKTPDEIQQEITQLIHTIEETLKQNLQNIQVIGKMFQDNSSRANRIKIKDRFEL